MYCLESPDMDQTDIFRVSLPSDINLKPSETEVNNNRIYALEGTAVIDSNTDWNNTLYREVADSEKNVPVRLIPYFAWGNRGPSNMTVWINYAR